MSHKLLVAILPIDVDVVTVLRRLKEEKGIIAADLSYGRGVGRFVRPGHRRRFGDVSEKEILSILVEAERAEEIFGFVYEAAEMDRPHGGILYQQPVPRATEYRLPADAPEE